MSQHCIADTTLPAQPGPRFARIQACSVLQRQIFRDIIIIIILYGQVYIQMGCHGLLSLPSLASVEGAQDISNCHEQQRKSLTTVSNGMKCSSLRASGCARSGFVLNKEVVGNDGCHPSLEIHTQRVAMSICCDPCTRKLLTDSVKATSAVRFKVSAEWWVNR